MNKNKYAIRQSKTAKHTIEKLNVSLNILAILAHPGMCLIHILIHITGISSLCRHDTQALKIGYPLGRMGLGELQLNSIRVNNTLRV